MATEPLPHESLQGLLHHRNPLRKLVFDDRMERRVKPPIREFRPRAPMMSRYKGDVRGFGATPDATLRRSPRLPEADKEGGPDGGEGRSFFESSCVF